MPNTYPTSLLASFGVIMTYTNVQDHDQKIPGNQKLSESLKQHFWDKIYLPRPRVEAAILANIKEDPTLLKLQGERGVGKSTMLLRVLQQLESRERYPRCVLDLQGLYALHKFDECFTAEEWQKALSKQLHDSITRQYFPDFDDRSDVVRCNWMLFSTDPTAEEKTGVLRRNLVRLYRESTGQPTNMKAVRAWTNDNLQLKEVSEIFAEASEHADHRDLIRAHIDAVEEAEKFIVVLDNVDRIPRELQSFVYRFAKDEAWVTRHHSKVIISIRHENAHLPDDDCAAEAMVTTTMELSERDTVTSYRQVIDARLDPAEFNKIISRRFDYFKNYEQVDPRYVKNQGPLYKQFVRALEILTRALHDTYAETLLIDIANQSVRSALRYHSEFIQDFVEKFAGRRGMDEMLKMLEAYAIPSKRLKSFLSSRLYGWIAAKSGALSDQYLNLVSVYQRSVASGFTDHNCDLSYLVLIILMRNKRISVSALTEKLGLIGFSKLDVKERLLRLNKLKHQQLGYVIYIREDRPIEKPEDIRDDEYVEINRRGERLISDVATAFTFLNRLLYNDRSMYKYDRDEVEGRYYAFRSFIPHARNATVFYADVAFAHSVELTRIARRLGSNKWEEIYRTKFTLDNKLQLERIIKRSADYLERVSEYVNDAEAAEKLNHYVLVMWKLNALFVRQVSKITRSTSHVLDFQSIIWHLINNPDSKADDFWSEEWKKPIAKYLVSN